MAAHREGDISTETGSTPAAKVLRREHDRVHAVCRGILCLEMGVKMRASSARDAAGGIASRGGVAVCTPRQQHQQQQLLQREVVEKANVTVIGKRGKTYLHISREAGRPLSRVQSTVGTGGATLRDIQPRAFCCWNINGGRKRARGDRGLSAAALQTPGVTSASH